VRYSAPMSRSSCDDGLGRQTWSSHRIERRAILEGAKRRSGNIESLSVDAGMRQ
jgi:hypothetical protein